MNLFKRFRNWIKTEGVKKYEPFVMNSFLSMIYVLAGLLGFLFAIPPGNVSAVWPASGLAVGILLSENSWKKYWFGIFFGSLVVNLITFKFKITHHLGGQEIISSITIAIGSLIQGVLLSHFIRKFINNSFFYLIDVLKFVSMVFACCLISSFIGVTSLASFKFVELLKYNYTWLTWYLGDIAGILLITPMFMTWKNNIFKQMTLDKFLEYLLLFTTVFLVSEIIFGLQKEISYALLFSIAPVFVWAALRFSQFEVSLAFFITAVIAIVNTDRGSGAFAEPKNTTSFLVLQYYIAIIGLTKLIISTCIYELKKSKLEIQNSYQKVEELVRERTKELEEVNNDLSVKLSEREETRRILEISQSENEKLRILTKQLNKLS